MLELFVHVLAQSDVTGSANLPAGHVFVHMCEAESPKVPMHTDTQLRVELSAK
jgi:hypothetical protein